MLATSRAAVRRRLLGLDPAPSVFTAEAAAVPAALSFEYSAFTGSVLTRTARNALQLSRLMFMDRTSTSESVSCFTSPFTSDFIAASAPLGESTGLEASSGSGELGINHAAPGVAGQTSSSEPNISSASSIGDAGAGDGAGAGAGAGGTAAAAGGGGSTKATGTGGRWLSKDARLSAPRTRIDIAASRPPTL